VLEKNEATLAANALDLDSIIIKDIMVKKAGILSMKKGTKIDAALKLFKETGFSRIPVTHNNKFVGIVILKDIFLSKEETIDAYVIQVAKISQNKIVSKALEVLRSSRSHLAFVYKTKNSEGVMGIVTLEDIVEELIGEIYDEHDKYGKIKEVGLHKYEAKGSVKMGDVNKMLKIKITNDVDISLKKWLQSHIKRKVKKGLTYSYNKKVMFKVIENKNNEETIIKIVQK
ncbi:MAG: CBS domain-containing protein, partial [Mycoplasmataceae bacterium]|nr:CBS domain-containing protein [Mycoplasmataceae bacterium]